MRKIKAMIQGIIERFGYSLVISNGAYEANVDIGRDYVDGAESMPRFILKKAPALPWTGPTAKFVVDNGKSILEEVVYYSHLTLLKLCKHYLFNTVLDIGSHERKVTKIFQHIGKQVTTIEVAPGYEADYKNDYLEQEFPEKFDAIWCSQTYEHQRNPGLFLDKIFDDLKDGGILALTVPYQINKMLLFGHININSPLMLIYQLVCAGFDCSELSLKCYNSNIGIIVKKKYNGIKRNMPFGSLPGNVTTSKQVAELLGDEFFFKMEESFPKMLREQVRTNYMATCPLSINWKIQFN